MSSFYFRDKYILSSRPTEDSSKTPKTIFEKLKLLENQEVLIICFIY